MKKIIFFLFIPLIVGFVSCKKEPIDSKHIIEATSVGPGGTVSPSGKNEVDEGGNLGIAVDALSGYVIDSIKVDRKNVIIPENQISYIYNFSKVISDHILEATFKKVVPNVKMVTVETSVGPGGTINPLGITQVDSGGSLAIVLTPDPGFAPDSVILNGISHPYTENIYDLFNITADTKVKVVFKKTLDWYLMNGEWDRDSIIRRNNADSTWIHAKVWGVSGALQIAVTFLPTGRVSEYWNGVYSGDWTWSIDETTNPPTLNAGGGEIWKIEKLDDKSLVLARYDIQCLVCSDPTDPKTFIATKDVYSHH